MADKLFNVLFLCTGNSARSIIAEAIINNLDVTWGKFRGFSAGSHPKGVVNPYALELLARNKVLTDKLRSKSWDEFAKPDAPHLDFVITVCDQAAAEACPVWPGQPMTAHWGLPDPAGVTGTEDEIRKAFQITLVELRRRIELLASLPVDKLDRIALQESVRDIAQQ